MDIVLYGRPYNRSDRVQWTLEELGLPYQYRVLDVFGLEHRGEDVTSRYSLARLPFVELDGRVIFESGAIMLYLAQRFRDRVDLVPDMGDSDYVKVLQWLFFAVSTLESADPGLDASSGPAPSASLAKTLDFLEQQVEGAKYIAAGRFTIADIALANGLKWFGPDALNDRPHLTRYFSEHTSRSAFRKIAEQPEYPSCRPG